MPNTSPSGCGSQPDRQGSFNIDGTSITATAANLSYGIPPGGDDNLGRHGIYQTYYHEVSFSFDATDTVTSYNVQDNAGGALS
jgi:hypothetical protein